MKRTLAAILLVLVLPPTVIACLWDRDTPAGEARGLPEVVAAITGRFDRNPPLFYEMRLDRVSRHLESDPGDLEAYDDAAVACDRLGRHDEAIAWMERKRQVMDGSEASLSTMAEPRYRYYANLGTFRVHRWLQNGADRTNLDEVRAAREEIARAIEINPNAHFGREKYQLMVLDWILNPPAIAMESWPSLPTVLGRLRDDQPGLSPTMHDAVRGLTGLVVLGQAWESVDVFNALSMALSVDEETVPGGPPQFGGRSMLSYLARYRAAELIDEGKSSLLPNAPKGEELKEGLYRSYSMEEPGLKTAYKALRAEADTRHLARTDYMMRRLKQGQHPDTDPNFWTGYTEKPAPSLPRTSQGGNNDRVAKRMAFVGTGILVAFAALITALIVFLIRLFRGPRYPKKYATPDKIDWENPVA